MNPTLCYIKKEYFVNNGHFVKMLDGGNPDKQSHRMHLCLSVQVDNNTYLIPLRNNLGADLRVFGRIGHSIPSQKRPMAGLDYRYALVVNDNQYIIKQTQLKIPKSQYNRIMNDYSDIVSEFSLYLKGFKKSVKKHRNTKEPLYKESCLVNFIDVL